ncbi:MAG: lysophospholipid acyltransferase family protein [Armatimonadota bacterium]|nr:lysophospholipid acyltransferase family protein [Armatimonadota bacterium]
MSKLSRKIADYALWRIVWWASNLISRSLRFRVEGFDRLLDHLATGKGLVLVVWHGRTLLPIYYCRNRGFWAIISLSRDGELQNRVVTRYGYRTIRGSSGKQGARAFLESVRRLQEGATLSVTPDGPKGPDRQVQMGTVLLAQRSGCPVLPIGASAQPRRLLGSWDSYMLPRPFGRAAVVFGEPLWPPGEASGEASEKWTAEIETALREVEQRAEALAKRQVNSLSL